MSNNTYTCFIKCSDDHDQHAYYADYDKIVGGDVGAGMVTCTRCNLPLRIVPVGFGGGRFQIIVEDLQTKEVACVLQWSGSYDTWVKKEI